MGRDELTVRNIDANKWASFTIDDYTPDFRKVRELRGVGKCAPVTDDERRLVEKLFADKRLILDEGVQTIVQRVRPLELHFVDFEYTAGVAVPLESSLVYEAAPEAMESPEPSNTQLDRLSFEAGQVIMRQGEQTERFFIIVEGEVEVRREGHGQDVTVTRQVAGQMFGEVGTLTGTPQPASYIALIPTTVMAVARASFQDVVSQSAAADLDQRLRGTLTDIRRDAPS